MFVQGGNVDLGYRLNSAGNYGYYWSSVSDTSGGAYYLYFDSGFVAPSRNDFWYFGFSVRCVALGSRIRFVAKTT